MKPWKLLAAALLAGPAAAQDASPYVEEQHREIKALSRADIESLLTGQGRGLAQAAELNGYPGPKHVLELADELELTAEQLEKTQVLYERMHAEAVRLGGIIVESERALDEAFAGGGIDSRELEAATAELGRLNGRLRFTHLSAHLAQAELLKASQVEAYRALRGYDQGTDDHGGGHDHP